MYAFVYIESLSRIVNLEPFQKPRQVSLDALVWTPKNRGGQQLVA